MTDENTAPSDDAAAGAPPPVAEETVIEPETLPTGEAATTGNRVLATLIDGVVGSIVSGIPVVGWVAGPAYMLTRDALPFLDGQSLGKKVMKLRAISTETGKPLTNEYGASALRNVLLLAFGIGALVELIVMSQNKDGLRLGDQWAKTKVIVEG